jgi:uncharacterized protein (DUF608 family)
MTTGQNEAWPVLTEYDQEHLARIALPLGGIGTGTVALGGRGDLRDWEIVNRPAKGFAPPTSFFALYARPHGGEAVARALEGALAPPFEGPFGATTPNHGLPRFRSCRFAAAYPLGQVLLADPDVPLEVRLEAFNPLVPGDSERSGIPAAILRVVLTNRTDTPVEAAVCGSLQNFIGADGTHGAPKANRNEFRTGAVRGVFMRSDGVDQSAEQWGTLALATTADAHVTYRTAWPKLSWGDTLLDFWDDWSDDGALEERDGAGDAPVASLAARRTVAPGASEALTFLLAWHFPNRQTWTPRAADPAGVDDYRPFTQTWRPHVEDNPRNRVGNHYATRFRDAWDVAERTAADLAALEADTVRFVGSFCASDLPDVVKEAALFNLSTLRSQTCFRTEDGRFYGWEGIADNVGSCHGSCTHVWNYEQASAFLFGDLARSMREVEFAHATDERGLMSFRVNLPLEHAREWGLAAADGQMGCIMKLYRDWQLCGDEAFLRSLWPHARRALEFCWEKGGWDADRDGVMEGCQHNTMDVEYYGPNPQMQGWYLGALRAAEEMARALGEEDFAQGCHALFEAGRRWADERLFNGEYYEHEIRPIADAGSIAPGLRHESMGARDLRDPELQLGAGCLVDQLVGQFMAHVCGLGYLLDPAHVRQTLAAIMRHNFRETLYGHFNHLRSFALSDESALLMASYPRGRRPRRPFPYFNEVMTGFEYTAAVGMLYEGLTDEGLRCFAAIRARYDGRRRSPFDEAECGHHYARAMASWAGVLALTGFRYSAVEQQIAFASADAPAQWFWSSGGAWGTVAQRPEGGGAHVTLRVLHGSLPLRRIALAGLGSAALDQPRTLTAGEQIVVQVGAAR